MFVGNEVTKRRDVLEHRRLYGSGPKQKDRLHLVVELDKAYGAWGKKNFPRATEKARGSTNAHSGKALIYPAQPWGRSKRLSCAGK